MNVYLDANVLISVLNKEYPAFSDCARVLSLADQSKFKLFTSPLCLGISWYFSEKKSGAVVSKKKISELIKHIKITSQDHLTAKRALENKQIKDFEDGLGYYSAIDAKCSCIVSYDKKDFYFSELEVLDAGEFLEKYYFKLK